MQPLTKTEPHELVLAIDPMSRGFGYALFGKPNNLVDWGITDIRFNVSAKSLSRVEKLIDYYHPNRIILEKTADKSSRRCERIKKLLKTIRELAKQKKIKVNQYSPQEVQDVFREFECHNKHQRAETIGKLLPPLASRIPPKRDIWMSEDPRTNLFDAVALAVTYYYLEE